MAASNKDIKKNLHGEGRDHAGKEGEEEKWEGLKTPGRLSGKKDNPVSASVAYLHPPRETMADLILCQETSSSPAGVMF